MHYWSREKCWYPLYTRENLYPRKLSIDTISSKTRKFYTVKIRTLTVLVTDIREWISYSMDQKPCCKHKKSKVDVLADSSNTEHSSLTIRTEGTKNGFKNWSCDFLTGFVIVIIKLLESLHFKKFQYVTNFVLSFKSLGYMYRN